jgi:large subunit ribosomal protein L30
MSTKAKRKPKPRATRKQKPKAARKPTPAVKKPKRVVEAPPQKTPEVEQVTPKKSFLVAIRLKGSVALPHYLTHTLSSLGLERRFSARLLEKNGSTIGMLRDAKDCLTWGEVTPEDIAALLRERAKYTSGISFTDETVKEKFGVESVDALVKTLVVGQIELSTLWEKGVKPTFQLHPPSGGFNGSIKRPSKNRGELGYRGAAISDLLTRMT